MPQFFVSRGIAHDHGFVMRFYRDLAAKVAELTGAQDGVGFLRPVDSGGPPWPSDVRESLASCQAFVALMSPEFFLNDRCGRELWVFSERLRRHQQRTDQRVDGLVWVLWSGNGALGGDTEVVSQLVRLRSERARYEQYLVDVAGRIADLLRSAALPEADADLDPETAPNAFDHPDLVATSGAPPASALFAAATRRVHFVIAAGSRTEMSAVRDDVTSYGDRPQDWSPYRSAHAEPLTAQARAIAAEQLLGSDVADLDELPERADLARENNDIVVLLVDSWITKLAAQRRQLLAFDERDDATVAILAPTNADDPETARHRGELRSELATTLPRSLRSRDSLVHIEIDNRESFQEDLATTLEEAQNRIFSRGRVFRRPAGEPPSDRPILQGP